MFLPKTKQKGSDGCFRKWWVSPRSSILRGISMIFIIHFGGPPLFLDQRIRRGFEDVIEMFDEGSRIKVGQVGSWSTSSTPPQNTNMHDTGKTTMRRCISYLNMVIFHCHVSFRWCKCPLCFSIYVPRCLITYFLMGSPAVTNSVANSVHIDMTKTQNKHNDWKLMAGSPEQGPC